MRILRIVYDWPPPWDGLAPHPYEMTVAQVRKGHIFDVFCGWWPNAGDIPEIQNVKVTKFIREFFPNTLVFTTGILMFLYYLYWRRTNKPDLIHIHGHFGYWVYMYRKTLKKYRKDSEELKIPLVAHFHNTVEGRWQNMVEKDKEIKSGSKYLGWPLAKKSDQLAVEVADAYIFVSNETRDEAIKYYQADPSKCFVVETGVNTQLFSSVGTEEVEKSRRDLGIDLMDKVIVNHGIMVERKNIHLLVQALAFLPHNHKLLLMGSGDPEYLDKLKTMIEEGHLRDRVIMVGYTPYPQVPIAFQVSDIFVLPSSWEGLPKVVMQSLGCGVKTLVSGFKLSEQIDGLYYLKDLTPENIAREITEVLNTTTEVDIAKVARLYSWDVRAYEVEKVYTFVKAFYEPNN